MKLRDYFAAKFFAIAHEDLEGLSIESVSEEIGITPALYKPSVHWPIALSLRAYRYADAMMAVRNDERAEKGEKAP